MAGLLTCAVISEPKACLEVGQTPPPEMPYQAPEALRYAAVERFEPSVGASLHGVPRQRVANGERPLIADNGRPRPASAVMTGHEMQDQVLQHGIGWQ